MGIKAHYFRNAKACCNADHSSNKADELVQSIQAGGYYKYHQSELRQIKNSIFFISNRFNEDM